MTILGIDPGIATVGFGVVCLKRGNPSHLRHGVISTPPEHRLPERLATIYEDMCELINAFRPDALAVEELFWGTNITTGIHVSHGRGVVLLAAQQHGLPVFEYTPLQVKQAVTGYGKADKQQVMSMVMRLLSLTARPKPDDAADALAVAICHVYTAGSLLSGEKC